MFGFLYSRFLVLLGLWISWTKTQTLPNLRLPISSVDRQRRSPQNGSDHTTCNKRRCLLSIFMIVVLLTLFYYSDSCCSRNRREIYEINSYYYAAQGKNTITADHLILASCAIRSSAAKTWSSKTCKTRGTPVVRDAMPRSRLVRSPRCHEVLIKLCTEKKEGPL